MIRLSPVKRNRNNTMDYVSITLQTASSKTIEALLYSPHERPLFVQSQDSRTPLKLKDHTYTEDKTKIVINDMTNVTTPHHSEYSFQYVEISSPSAKQDPISILEVLNSKKEWDNVVLTGKMTQIKEPVVIGKNKLNLCECILADPSASIHLHARVGREHTKSQPRKLFHISCASSPCVGQEEKTFHNTGYKYYRNQR